METMRAFVERCLSQIFVRLPRREAIDPLFYACAFMLACSLILGGTARNGFPGDAILALLAIPLLALSIWRLFEVDITRQMRWALWFCLALVALPLLQLVPLPAWLWTALPHREISAESFVLTRQTVPWMPLSVWPESTWLGALSLLPPLSLFIGILLLGYRDRRWLSLVVFAIGVISAFLGLLQVAQGPTSALRLYQFTNTTEAVGFFANRNHFAALLYVVVLLVSAWAVNAGAAAGLALSRKEFDAASTLVALGCFTLLVVLLAAQAVARSRAGMGLTMVAVCGAFFLGVTDRGVRGGASTPRRWLFVAIAIALVLTLQFGLYRILERFDPNMEAGPGNRTTFTSNTIQAARAYMPAGSGVGSFVPVYHLFEKPEDVVANFYIIRATNDLAESWLENGVFGLALMGWFAFWFVRRSLEIWRGGLPPAADAIDCSLARSATIIIPLLAAHSSVDYPVRTSAVMAVSAFACALMIAPPASVLRARLVQTTAREPAKKLVQVSPAPALAAIQPKALPSLPPSPPKERWGTDIQWPDEWRASRDHDPPIAPEGLDKPR
jgi:hypothetical protein